MPCRADFLAGRWTGRIFRGWAPFPEYLVSLPEILKEKGIRDKYHVILGGAPVTQEWVDQCGADSWGENAGKAVEKLERVMEDRSK